MDRSILFFLWSGTKVGHTGAEAFFDHPPWSRDKITGVLLLADDLRRFDRYQQIVERSRIDSSVVLPRSPSRSTRINNREQFLSYPDLLKDAVELTRVTLLFVHDKSIGN